MGFCEVWHPPLLPLPRPPSPLDVRQLLTAPVMFLYTAAYPMFACQEHAQSADA